MDIGALNGALSNMQTYSYISSPYKNFIELKNTKPRPSNINTTSYADVN